MSSVDWPPPADLVDAVREFLESDVMAATTGRTQYLTRVAVNVLAAVGRELRDEGAFALQQEVLGRFGAADEAALCDLIRGGELDDRLPELGDALRPVVRRRLEISNPRYLA